MEFLIYIIGVLVAASAFRIYQMVVPTAYDNLEGPGSIVFMCLFWPAMVFAGVLFALVYALFWVVSWIATGRGINENSKSEYWHGHDE